MNQLLPYEESILKKMDELPSPDMKDSIWAAVQAEINAPSAGLSQNDSGIGTQVTAGSGKLITGIIITLIIVTVSVIIATRKKRAKQNAAPVPETIQPQKDSFSNEKKRIAPQHPLSREKIQAFTQKPKCPTLQQILLLSFPNLLL